MTLQEQLGPLLPAVVAGPFPQYVNVGHAFIVGIEPTFAPPEWRQLAEPCETCKGSKVLGISWGEHMKDVPCPPCHGTGRKVHTLTADCPTCRGTKTEVRGGNYFDCGGCDAGGRAKVTATGTVSVDVTVRLVQVVDVVLDGGYREPTEPRIEIVSPTYIREWYWNERHQQWQHRSITPLGDPLTPGDWVAILEPVDPATP